MDVLGDVRHWQIKSINPHWSSAVLLSVKKLEVQSVDQQSNPVCALLQGKQQRSRIRSENILGEILKYETPSGLE